MYKAIHIAIDIARCTAIHTAIYVYTAIHTYSYTCQGQPLCRGVWDQGSHTLKTLGTRSARNSVF